MAKDIGFCATIRAAIEQDLINEKGRGRLFELLERSGLADKLTSLDLDKVTSIGGEE